MKFKLLLPIFVLVLGANMHLSAVEVAQKYSFTNKLNTPVSVEYCFKNGTCQVKPLGALQSAELPEGTSELKSITISWYDASTSAQKYSSFDPNFHTFTVNADETIAAQ